MNPTIGIMHDMEDPTALTGEPAHRILKPIMTQQWMDVTYLHWPYEPDVVQALLPRGLEVDVFDGRAWVGLVPFHMMDIALPFTPPIPYLGSFPETNVRTYVRGVHGPGVWFNSLDVPRLLPVLVARTTYRLPYMWSSMDIRRAPGSIAYTARRRWPGPRHASSRVEVEIGSRIAQPTELDHFLSARWGLYTQLGSRLAYARVEHEPWPLHEASVVDVTDDLVAAAGYPPPAGKPRPLHSPGVSVSVDRPRFVAEL
jgi:uncharacterized protein YqjF (DUF2071 family)